MTASASRIAEKLGGACTLGQPVHDWADLRHVVEEGLPLQSLNTITDYLAASATEAADMRSQVTKGTAPGPRVRLSLEESKRTERLARLAALAEDVWEDASLAREFLTSTQPQLGGERPIDLTRSESGAREVEALLMKIEHALPV